MSERTWGTSPEIVVVDENSSGSSVSADLEVGSSGLTYRPLRVLGEGSTAQVLLACAYGRAAFSKLVVLKVMHAHHERPRQRADFLEEARVSARLNHPNLVQVYEVVDTGDAPFMVMEYLEGKPLTRLRGNVLPREMLLTIVAEALVGLHYAHEVADFDGRPLNVVHRDVSPHNIFVTYDGAVKVLDFGVAQTASGEGHAQTGEVKGKLAYMAPEQLRAEEVDRRADIFAMGAVLWELVSRASLWADVPQGVLMRRLASGDIPRPRPEDELDAELERILMRATAPEASERYQSALEMQHALNAYLTRSAPSVTPRDVGRALAATFEAERNGERETIRAAMEALSLPPPPVLPVAGPPAHSAAAGTQRRLSAWFAVPALLLATFVASGLFQGPRRVPIAPPRPLAAVKAAARTVRVSFEISPAEGEIVIDGASRGNGSFALRVPADAREHEVVVRAPGFAPVRRLVRFAESQTLRVALNALAPLAEASAEVSGALNAKSGLRAGGPPRPQAVGPSGPGLPSQRSSQSDENANCEPPFYFRDGIKTFRQECL